MVPGGLGVMSYVVGAFADFDWSNIDTRGTLHIESTTVDVSAFDLNNAWTVGGRAGVLITSSTLVYGLLGYSWFDFDNLRVTAVGSDDGSRGSDSGGGFARILNEPIRKGNTLGGGIEQKITPNLSLKAEYRFTDLGDADQAIDMVEIDRHSKIQIVRVGAAYRIGWGDSATGSPDQAPVTRTWTGFYGGAGIAVDALVQNASLHAVYDYGSLRRLRLDGSGF
jgi:outer membrane immunogenic protein